MPCVAQKRARAPLAKFVPLLVMMLCGTPYQFVMSAMKVTAVGPFSFLIGFASIHLVNLSTATSICVMPPRAVLTCFFCFLLDVHGDSRGVEFYVCWDDGFGAVDEEERCEAG